MDLSTLAIRVTSNGINQTDSQLSRLERQSAQTEKAVESLTKMMGSLKLLMSAGFGMQGISSLIQMADKMSTLNTQVKLVSSSTQEYTKAQRELFEIAQRTYGSLEATSTLYVRSSRALSALGLSQKQVLGFTETLNKAMAVGGVGAQEQASALLQLSQALGSGKLQGDEFKSISETAPIILDVISTYMGKSREEIKKLGTEGKITSELIYKAMESASGRISAEFDKMPMTFGGAMQQMENAALKFVDGFAQSTGVFSAAAEGVSFLAKNFDTLALAVGALGIGQATRLLTAYIAQVKAASLAVQSKTASTTIEIKGQISQQVATAKSIQTTIEQTQAVIANTMAKKAEITDNIRLAQSEMGVLSAQLRTAQSEATRNSIRQQMARQSQLILTLQAKESSMLATLNTQTQALKMSEQGLMTTERQIALSREQLTQATTRLTLAQRALNVTSSALNGALGLLGGPMGAAMIAAFALFYFYQKAQQAKEEAINLESANRLLQTSYEGLSDAAIGVKLTEFSEKLKQQKEEVENFYTAFLNAKMRYKSGGLFAPSDAEMRDYEDKYLVAKEILEKYVQHSNTLFEAKAKAMLKAGKTSEDVQKMLLAYGASTETVNAVMLKTSQYAQDQDVILNALSAKFQALGLNVDAGQISFEKLGMSASSLNAMLPALDAKLDGIRTTISGVATAFLIAANAVNAFKVANGGVAVNLSEKAATEVKLTGLRTQLKQAKTVKEKKSLQHQINAEEVKTVYGEGSDDFNAVLAARNRDSDVTYDLQEAAKAAQAGKKASSAAKKKQKKAEQEGKKLKENQDHWREYFADLQAQASSGYEHIAFEQNKALTEMLNRAKEAKASESEIAKARLLIEEKFLQERQALAEKYSPEKSALREFNEARNEIEQLRQAKFLSDLEAKIALQNAQWKKFKDAMLKDDMALAAEKYAPHRTAERVYGEQKAEIELLRQNGKLSDKEAGIANQQNEWQRFIDTADKSDPLNGIKQSFKAFGSEAENVMGNVAQITNAALGGMADQLTEFVMTGKADFRGLATSIIKDITNMIIKMMIFKAIEMGGKAMGFDMSFMKVGASGGGAFYTGGLVGFAQGGFTGLGGKYTPAGVVHKGEYVMTKEATSKLGVDYLDYLNYGMSRASASLGNNGFAYGGGAGVPTLHNATSSPKPSIMVKIINNGQAVEAKVSQEQDGDQTKITVELMQQMQSIAKQEAQKVITENFRAGGSFAR